MKTETTWHWARLRNTDISYLESLLSQERFVLYQIGKSTDKTLVKNKRLSRVLKLVKQDRWKRL